jgi:hypothetical protein
MEMAVFTVAHCRGAALRSVGLDVLTATDAILVKGHDECSTPSPVIYCNQQDREFFWKILDQKELQVKSLKQRGDEKVMKRCEHRA